MAESSLTIKEYMSAPKVIKKMNEMLQTPEAVRQFSTAVISIAGADDLLAVAEPRSLFNACLTASSLNLPINKNLGFAHIIGYKNNRKGGIVEAQFQLGARGFKELAQRSGRYKIIHEGDVREGELKSYNRLTGEIDFNWCDDDEERENLPVIGYFSYFKLDNGFESMVYWSVDKVRKHAERFSQAYKNDIKYNSTKSPWSTDFDGMAKKTVMKNNISKNGPLDINLQKAIQVDQAVIRDDGKTDYIDGELADLDDVGADDEEIDAIVDAQTEEANPYAGTPGEITDEMRAVNKTPTKKKEEPKKTVKEMVKEKGWTKDKEESEQGNLLED